MAKDTKLEQYLSRLDKALGQIPVSDRADIITEMKSHILDAQERESQQSIDQILDSLGEPESVANRYLLERGLKPGKPSKTPILKWLTIGFLGTFAISALLIVALAWKFSPLIKVDEEAGQVIILGGLIEVNEKEGKVKVGSTHLKNNGSFSFGATTEGKKTIDQKQIKQLKILFNNAKIELKTSLDNTLQWSCKYGGQKQAYIQEDKTLITINLSDTLGANCEIAVPAKLYTALDGANGKVELFMPVFPVDVKLSNGKIDITKDKNTKYKFDTKLTNGKIDGDLKSDENKDAYKINLQMVNGSIDINH